MTTLANPSRDVALTTAVRDGLPLGELAPGDVVHLAAGDMIPVDVRVLSSKYLFVNRARLTGESLPVERFHASSDCYGGSPAALGNVCFMGTSVENGTGTAVVVVTGPQTYFGSMAASIVGRQPQTGFDRGVERSMWLTCGMPNSRERPALR